MENCVGKFLNLTFKIFPLVGEDLLKSIQEEVFALKNHAFLNGYRIYLFEAVSESEFI